VVQVIGQGVTFLKYEITPEIKKNFCTEIKKTFVEIKLRINVFWGLMGLQYSSVLNVCTCRSFAFTSFTKVCGIIIK
jgi:hypothetical protein